MNSLLWRSWLVGKSHQLKVTLQQVIKRLPCFWRSWMNTVIGDGDDSQPFTSIHTVIRLQEPTLSPLLDDQEAVSRSVAVSIGGTPMMVDPAVVDKENHLMAESRYSPLSGDGYENLSTKDEGVKKKSRSIVESELLLVLYVVAHHHEVFYGEPLLRGLCQLGFRYGERSIFHRHLNPLGNGPILFSVANMVKPGIFKPNTMRDFTTPGVAFYMTIPAYGDSIQNFKLMLQAAQRLADDVGGVVLDDERHLLTLEKSEQYKALLRQLQSTAANMNS